MHSMYQPNLTRNGMMLLCLVTILASLAGFGQASLAFSQVTIDDGGYTRLVIAIHPDVVEDEELINAIKQSWTEASRDLFIATGNRAYFKQITILAPKTWTNKAYANAAGSENYDQADVVIAAPNPSYGNAPYTVQHEGCGKPGIRSHYTPTYLRDDKHLESYGRRGKAIVREWAHYRWGVFDETSVKNPFYWDPEFGSSDGPAATTCPRNLLGDIVDVESSSFRRCSLSDIDEDTNSYPPNCVFFPFEEQYLPINTSIMANHYLENVVTFCKDADDEEATEYNVHNIYAPNSQNIKCSMRSTWSVIKDSPDYSSWHVKSGATDTAPTFDIVKPQVQRFVLILDDSGSMRNPCGDTSRTECLKTAAYQFIKCAPNNSYVGIVLFGSYSRIIEYLTLLDSDEVRENLANSIVDLYASSGGTCLGCGILSGIEVLERGSTGPSGGRLIVITDGDENGSPTVKDVSGDVTTKAVIIDTIFISNQKNPDLYSLTTDSGGRNFIARSQSDLNVIFSELCSADSTAENSYQIHSATFEVTSSDGYQSFLYIDETIGVGTLFSFTWSVGDTPPRIYIISPTGCVYSNYLINATYCSGGNISHIVNVAFSTIEFRIPGVASVGKWIYVVDKEYGLGEMTSLVRSTGTGNAIQPITIESGMSRNDISSGAAIIYAKVAQGYNPVLGAAVVAVVTGPNLVKKFVYLYDNGAGSDIGQNDGIYSRYFTEFTGPGRYAVDITVENSNSTSPETKRQRRESRSSNNYRPGVVMSNGTVNVNANGAISNEGNRSVTTGVKSEDLGQFSRMVPSESFDYSGSVDVDSGATAPDEFPPSAITDLRMLQNDLEDYKKGVIILFTATGDDFDEGTAAGYELRYTYGDPVSLAVNFTSNKKIDGSNVTGGNLSDPAASGQVEEFILQTPDLPTDENGHVVNNSRLAFCIRAYDSDFNYGEPSNVAMINFFIAPVYIPTVPPTSAPTTAADITSEFPSTAATKAVTPSQTETSTSTSTTEPTPSQNEASTSTSTTEADTTTTTTTKAAVPPQTEAYTSVTEATTPITTESSSTAATVPPQTAVYESVSAITSLIATESSSDTKIKDPADNSKSVAECTGCQAERSTLMRTTTALAVTTAIFFSSTSVLTILVIKSSKQIAGNV